MVTGVLVEADEVTTDTLRQVQPSRVLAALGPQPGRPGWITKGADGRSVLSFALGGATTYPLEVSVTPDALLEAYSERDDTGTTLGELRERATHKLRPAKREVVGRPDGTNSDRFYQRFAATYRSAATESSKPAVILAGENDVPVETVRRWIKEARRRGHLEPGRKGRAG